MRKIVVIGGGFTGTLTAVHLLRQADVPLRLTLINQQESLNKGIAFNPYSGRHLLNVCTANMSAFQKEPDHFLNWVMQQAAYRSHDRNLVARSFLPRRLYGQYLQTIWTETLRQATNVRVQVVDATVTGLRYGADEIGLRTSLDTSIPADFAVLATGNAIPGNPSLADTAFFSSPRYFQNPWEKASVTGLSTTAPVLIIGNGLTMVDTVIGLREAGFSGTVVSLSPHGFGILPHRHSGLVYTKLAEELPPHPDLHTIVSLFNKHRKRLQAFGVSPEPLVDSLRVRTQALWRGLCDDEKRLFLARLRHLWGVARHRIPVQVYDDLLQQRLAGSLQVIAGRLVALRDTGDGVAVDYFDKRAGEVRHLTAARVINCTGPESNLLKMEDNFLKQCLLDGVVRQDEWKLGLNADPQSFEIINANGQRLPNLLTLGSNLRGELWESTAVNELRVQAEAVAGRLLQKCSVAVAAH